MSLIGEKERGDMAKHVAYYEFDQNAPIVCTHCGATGSYAEWAEYYDALFDITCGVCGRMLYIVGYPTIEDIREYAERGNEDAISSLPAAKEREAFLAKLEAEQLKTPGQLPELEGDELEFTWDFLDAGDEHFTLILLGQEEIWREPAVYDGYYRFEEVRNLLKERYGERYAGLTYTERSMVWLFD